MTSVWISHHTENVSKDVKAMEECKQEEIVIVDLCHRTILVSHYQHAKC